MVLAQGGVASRRYLLFCRLTAAHSSTLPTLQHAPPLAYSARANAQEISLPRSCERPVVLVMSVIVARRAQLGHAEAWQAFLCNRRPAG
jgi:hypothetical protein